MKRSLQIRNILWWLALLVAFSALFIMHHHLNG